jgi:hypothetical protein
MSLDEGPAPGQPCDVLLVAPVRERLRRTGGGPVRAAHCGHCYSAAKKTRPDSLGIRGNRSEIMFLPPIPVPGGIRARG